METHSSILAWEILWTEEPDGLQKGLRGRKELDVTEQLSVRTHSVAQRIMAPCTQPVSY